MKSRKRDRLRSDAAFEVDTGTLVPRSHALRRGRAIKRFTVPRLAALLLITGQMSQAERISHVAFDAALGEFVVRFEPRGAP